MRCSSTRLSETHAENIWKFENLNFDAGVFLVSLPPPKWTHRCEHRFRQQQSAQRADRQNLGHPASTSVVRTSEIFDALSAASARDWTAGRSRSAGDPATTSPISARCRCSAGRSRGRAGGDAESGGRRSARVKAGSILPARCPEGRRTGFSPGMTTTYTAGNAGAGRRTDRSSNAAHAVRGYLLRDPGQGRLAAPLRIHGRCLVRKSFHRCVARSIG